jgi:hypothetical protein
MPGFGYNRLGIIFSALTKPRMQETRNLFQRVAVLLLLAVATTIIPTACSSHTSSNPGSVATTNFGNEISLTSYTIRSVGEHNRIDLQWKALAKVSVDYIVFIHVLRPDGTTAFQLDHPLRSGAGMSTSGWVPGDAVEDHFLATPPQGVPSGPYSLRIGLFVDQPRKVAPVIQTVLSAAADPSWKGIAVVVPNVECK